MAGILGGHIFLHVLSEVEKTPVINSSTGTRPLLDDLTQRERLSKYKTKLFVHKKYSVLESPKKSQNEKRLILGKNSQVEELCPEVLRFL